MKTLSYLLLVISFLMTSCTNQNKNTSTAITDKGSINYTGPIIDMHIHCYSDEQHPGGENFYGNSGSKSGSVHFTETYDRFKKYNIVKAVVSAELLENVERWKSKDEDNRIIRGFMILYSPNDNGMNPERFENLVKEKKIEVFGELAPYYDGKKLSDPEWQPYLKICEMYDIPVAVHTGGGGPGGTYTWSPNARLSLGDPFLIEDVLVNYPKLRIYLMHAGSIWHEHALRMMAYYPQLYVDLGFILYGTPMYQRYSEEFLKNAKQAEVLDRVMFGSDQEFWPHDAIDMSIEFLNSLDFLTERDKRDIFYNNAARFLRLSEEQIAKHHEN